MLKFFAPVYSVYSDRSTGLSFSQITAGLKGHPTSASLHRLQPLRKAPPPASVAISMPVFLLGLLKNYFVSEKNQPYPIVSNIY